MDGCKVIREDVFAGGVGYKAGVRIGEAALTWEDYYIEEESAGESVDGFQEPDYENNRKKIDDKIDSGHICLSTLLRRKKWHEAHVDYSGSPFVLGAGFWREVPLINTAVNYIDKTVATAAFKQSPFSILFFPATLIGKKPREKVAREIPALCLFLADPNSKEEESEFDKNSSLFVKQIVAEFQKVGHSGMKGLESLIESLGSKDITRYKREVVLSLRQLCSLIPESNE